jgi:hypothetical protein
MEPSSGALRGEASASDEECRAEQGEGREHELAISRAWARPDPTGDRAHAQGRGAALDRAPARTVPKRHEAIRSGGRAGARPGVARNGRGFDSARLNGRSGPRPTLGVGSEAASRRRPRARLRSGNSRAGGKALGRARAAFAGRRWIGRRNGRRRRHRGSLEPRGRGSRLGHRIRGYGRGCSGRRRRSGGGLRNRGACRLGRGRRSGCRRRCGLRRRRRSGCRRRRGRPRRKERERVDVGLRVSEADPEVHVRDVVFHDARRPGLGDGLALLDDVATPNEQRAEMHE